MSLFTLDWFKANQKKKLSKLIIEEQKLKNDLLKAQLGATEKKLYSKLKMVNDVLTIVFENGEIMTKIPATVEDFVRVKDAVSRNEILNVFVESSNQKDDEFRKHKAMVNIARGINVLDKIDDFEVVDGAVYLKGIKRSLPELLVNRFMEIVSEFIDGEVVKNELFTDERYLSLKRFFMWCCLNPRAEVADSLYEFLMKNSFRITRQGFFVALRNVVTLHGSNELVQFVSNAYTKVKAVWKKKPDDYHVILQPDGSYKMMHVEDMFKTTEEPCEYCDGTGEVWYEDCEDEENGCNDMCDYCDGTGKVKVHRRNYEGEQLGSLTELYLDLPNRHENRFTDDWTKTFDIRIGRVVSMPMEECNWSTQDCAAAGLHFTADEIHYVGCGDQSILMVINPMKVVGIGEKKGRCYEYLPIMTVPRDEATRILHDLDFDTIDLDEFYIEHELESLAEKAQENFAVEAKKHQFNIPAMSSGEIGNIVVNLKKMKDELGRRVQQVV